MTAKPAHPWQYFLLVYLMSTPFWLIAGSIPRGGLPDNLPLTDIGAALTPTIAALILRYREGGGVAVRQLLARAHDYHRITTRRWLAFAILLFPALYLLTWLAMRAVGLPVPLPAAPAPALLLAVASSTSPLSSKNSVTPPTPPMPCNSATARSPPRSSSASRGRCGICAR